MGTNYLILFASLLVNQVRGQCQFTFKELYGSNGAFTYHDYKGNLKLQLSPIVKEDVSLTMHCGGEETHSIKCKKDKGRFIFQPQLPIRCIETLPESTVIRYNGDKKVYADCKETMYSIGHKINGKFLTLYDACYDTKTLRAIFTQARVYPQKIHLPRPTDLMFAPAPVMSANDAYSFFQNNIYNRFVKVFGVRQSYIPKTGLVINRGHLATAMNFLFEDQIRSTFKLVNVVPQFASINEGNWYKIEKWVHNLPLDKNGLIIRTGAFGTLKLKSTLKNEYKFATLLEPAKNPVPAWIYKNITKSKPDGTGTQSIVFLTYNNNIELPDRTYNQFCYEVVCPLKFEKSPKAGFTVCCNAHTFLNGLT